jgi:hypothetical protein
MASGADTVFRSATPAAAIPVVYKQAASEKPHATLLKATIPLVQPSAKSSTNSATKPTPKQSRRPAPLKQPQMLRTSTNRRAQDLHNNTVRAYYVTTEFSPTYAAVPFGDGWLIVQL